MLVLDNAEGIDKHDHETACRMAGLKAAAYLAEKCIGASVDEVEAYETPCFREAMAAHPGLPKVAYLYMLQSQGLLHDTYLYGVDVKRILPTFLNPTEVWTAPSYRALRIGLRQEQHLLPPEQPDYPICSSATART